MQGTGWKTISGLPEGSPEKYLSVAEKLGANLREGGVNGTTSNDRTN